MNGGLLPLMLIGATLGLALACAPHRTAVISFAALTGAALLMTFLPLPPGVSDLVFAGFWLSLIATAALTFFADRFTRLLMVPAVLNAGAWAGALAAISDRRGDLLVALLSAMLFLPARWFVLRGHQIVIRVVASWLIAIASLSMIVSVMPTPGYKLDHME